MSRPDSKKIIQAIIGKEATLTDEESRAELDAMTAENYDAWVLRALDDRNNERVYLDPTGTFPEHPTTRLFRIGIDSIRAGKPSEAFLTLLEDISDSAETTDVISAVYKTKSIKRSVLDAAEKHAHIANRFRQFVKERSKFGQSFDSIKDDFKARIETEGKSSWKTVERALEHHHIGWRAKPGRATTPKRRKEGW